jgi:hypothetical protein
MWLIFQGIELSTPHYDALLIGWAAQDLQKGVRFYGGDSQYSQAAAEARSRLATTYEWSIKDGGKVP